MKSKYETHVAPYIDKIAAWVKAGATAKEVAGKLHVCYSALRKYIDEGNKGDERYAALAVAFTRACEEPDDHVEAALYKRATGIEYSEPVYETRLDPNTNQYVEMCVRRVVKYIPPDPTSAMFWLTNRRPQRWQYKPQTEQADKDNERGVIVMPEVSKDA